MISRAFCPVAGLLVVALAATGCGDDDSDPNGPSGSGGGATGGRAVGGSAAGGQGGMATGGAGGELVYGDCMASNGGVTAGSDAWSDGADEANVAIEQRDSCERTYSLTTTAPLRDALPGNPRTVREEAGQPVVRTGHDFFDALYALAIEEVRENSVDEISDWSFNGGQPLPCPAGGCFETGRLWTYVWTRDTAYAVTLGLGSLDPVRSKNSLEFKTSTRRDGSDRQIVQDTGTGGSYPVSSDRVVWAMGAWETLKYLDGSERDAFLDLAHDAIVNTAEHDRAVVWDSADGLYRGEQSFLDWREQSYPAWVTGDLAQIAMSKSLSTNVGHYALLDVAAKLSDELGDSAARDQYAGWASALKQSISSQFYLPNRGLFSTFSTTALDPSPTQQFDLLGSALAVSFGVATPSQAESVVRAYPHLPKGAPVMWPQQQDVPIYHNRGIWPFVTALWVRAARDVGNDAAIVHGVRSLMRGAAMNLSHMENFEAVTGANWQEEGPTSGPVVNSQRQLWSVAGFASMVEDVVFGMEATQTGLRFNPAIPSELREDLFGASSSIALSNLRYRGKRVAVVVRLPDAGTSDTGMLPIESVRLNGASVGTDFIDEGLFADDNMIEVQLGVGGVGAEDISLLDDADIADYRNVFGPHTPVVSSIGISGDRIQISFNGGGESPADVTFNVYRDGVRIADSLAGSSTSFIDQDSADHATRTRCYAVEAEFVVSSNASQHSRPVCYWGPGAARVQSVDAQSLSASGGALVFNYGRWHYEGWGAPNDTLTVSNITAGSDGKHLVQLVAGNGAGDTSTGITCAVKAVEVWDGATLIASGQVAMPHAGTWDAWRDSTVLPVSLQAGKSYNIVIREDARSGNMSDFAHFTLYGGMGGVGGRFNNVNIAEVKLLALGAP